MLRENRIVGEAGSTTLTSAAEIVRLETPRESRTFVATTIASDFAEAIASSQVHLISQRPALRKNLLLLRNRRR
jgi:hypothetical protein